MNHFGIRKQMKKINEEVYELLEAIDNYEDFPVVNLDKDAVKDLSDDEVLDVLRANIVEELGDTLILLTQIIARYNIGKQELDTIMDYKLERTINRIKSDYYG